MIYGSVCSGIEAASVAWEPLGWRCAFVSEIDKHASAVLRYHYPNVRNYGDFTTIPQRYDAGKGGIHVLVGGTPCQSFSIAGLRGGLDDDRGNLTLEFLRLAEFFRPTWIIWENVPGVLSSNDGRDFGTFLGGLAELRYGFAYRILDAQYVRTQCHGGAVPQRRRRVFVVGCALGWQSAAAVLFDAESMRRHPPPRRKAGAGLAGGVASCINSGGQQGGFRTEPGEHLVPAYQCHGGNVGPNGTLRTGHNVAGGVPFVMAAGQGNAEVVRDGEPSLTCNHEAPILAMPSPVAGTLLASGSGTARTGNVGSEADMLVPMAQQLRAVRSIDPESIHTISIRGRENQRALEWHTDGVANALVGSGGGHDGIGAGAVAYETALAFHYQKAVGVLGDVSHTLTAEGSDASEDGSGRGTPVVTALAFQANASAQNSMVPAPVAPTMDVGKAGGLSVFQPHLFTVRRLMPVECERLQGFPDEWTKWGDYGNGKRKRVSDTQRYKLCGNSMARNVMRHLGDRVELINALLAELGMVHQPRFMDGEA